VLVCTPLLFVPGFGHLTFAIAMAIISIRFLAWDGVDYSLSRRRLSFRQKREFMKANRSATLGHGAIAFSLMTVPFLALFALPVLAAGGTVLYCRIQQGQEAHG